MKLAGAEKGRLRLVSEPLEVVVLPRQEDEEGGAARVVKARLRVIPPKIETACASLARWYLDRLYGQEPQAEEVTRLSGMLALSWSLVVDDGMYRTPVYAFPSVFNTKGHLVGEEERLQALHSAEIMECCPNPSELWADYHTFRRTEFPPYPTDEQLDQLMEDAKKKPLMTLLSEHGFWGLQRLLTGLGRRLFQQTFDPGNSTAGRS